MSSLDLDAGLGSILFAIAVEQAQRNTRASADNKDDILLSPLGVGQALAQRLAKVTLVSGSQSSAAGNLDKHTGIVSEEIGRAHVELQSHS